MNKKLFGIALLAGMLVLSACSSGEAMKKTIAISDNGDGSSGGGSAIINHAPVIEQFEFYISGCGGGGSTGGYTTWSCQLNYDYIATDDFGIRSVSKVFSTPTHGWGGGYEFPPPGVLVINHTGNISVDQEGVYNLTIWFTDAQGLRTSQSKHLYVENPSQEEHLYLYEVTDIDELSISLRNIQTGNNYAYNVGDAFFKNPIASTDEAAHQFTFTYMQERCVGYDGSSREYNEDEFIIDMIDTADDTYHEVYEIRDIDYEDQELTVRDVTTGITYMYRSGDLFLGSPIEILPNKILEITGFGKCMDLDDENIIFDGEVLAVWE